MRGLINEVKIPVQELGSQRGEGAYFQRGFIFGRIWYNHMPTLFSVNSWPELDWDKASMHACMHPHMMYLLYFVRLANG